MADTADLDGRNNTDERNNPDDRSNPDDRNNPDDRDNLDDRNNPDSRNKSERHNNRDDGHSLPRAGSRLPTHPVRRTLISVVVVVVAVVALVATLVIGNHVWQDNKKVDAVRTACSQSVTAFTKARESLSRRIAQARKDGLGELTTEDVADPSTVSDFAHQLSTSQAVLKKAKKPASCVVPSGSSETRISALAAARKKNKAMSDSLEQQEKRLKAAIEALTKSRDAKKKSEVGSAGQSQSGSAGSRSGGSTAGSGSSGSGSGGSGSSSGSGTGSTDAGGTGSNGGSGSNSLDGLGPGSPVRKDKNSPYKPNLNTIPEQPR